jgi:hypothetical protein
MVVESCSRGEQLTISVFADQDHAVHRQLTARPVVAAQRLADGRVDLDTVLLRQREPDVVGLRLAAVALRGRLAQTVGGGAI